MLDNRKINYIKEKRDEEDFCNVCGYKRKLTWDHVPPKAVTESRSVNVNRAFEGIPKDARCSAVYYKGIKFRSVCEHCNNVILGANDKYLAQFTREIKLALENTCGTSIYIETDISGVCKAVLGHMLAAKNSFDKYCKIDKELRDYLLGRISKPNCKLYYWIYPYDTIHIVRDVALVNLFNASFPSGTISVIACYPVGFILVDERGDMPGFVNLISLISEDEDANRGVAIDINTAYYPNTKRLRHFLWPCNIGDDKYSVGAVLTGKYAQEDSRFATKRENKDIDNKR